MEDVLKLHSFSVISKVLNELDRNVGLKDRTLAEYIIGKAQDAKDQEDFIKQLEKDGGEFAVSFMHNIYSLIIRMRPSKRTEADMEFDGTHPGKLPGEESNRLPASGPAGPLLYVPQRDEDGENKQLKVIFQVAHSIRTVRPLSAICDI